MSRDYIYGLAERKNEIHLKLGKAAGWMFIFTTLLAFFDSVVGMQISVLGISFLVKPIFAASLCFIAASAFLSVVFACIDAILMDNYLATIGRSVHMYSFGLYTLPKSAVNLWSEAFTPKYFGPISARGHRSAMIVVVIFYFAVLMLLALYPTVICSRTIWQIFLKSDATIAEYALAILSTLMLGITWLLSLSFCIKFTFEEANFNEADGTPTPEFVARVEAESAQKDPSIQG